MATARFLQSLALSTPKEHNQFDLGFFMSSTDVGLYNVAKKIFSYLDPTDLTTLRKIGRKNKLVDEFLNKEHEYLWKKFEMVTLKISKKKTAKVIGPDGGTRRMLQDVFKVSVWAFPKNPESFNIVSVTGDLRGVAKTVYHIRDMFRDHYYHIQQFEEDNIEVLSSLKEKTKSLEARERALSRLKIDEKLKKVTLKVLKEDNIEILSSLKEKIDEKLEKMTLKVLKSLIFITDLRKMSKDLEEDFKVSVKIEAGNSGWESFYFVSITGDLRGVCRAIQKVKTMISQFDESMEDFEKVNSEIFLLYGLSSDDSFFEANL